MFRTFFSNRIARIFFSASAAVILCGCSGKSAAQNLREALNSAERGDCKSALRAAGRAAKQQPKSVSLQLLQAILGERCGQTELAIAAARRAVELAPQSFAAHYTLGRLCAAQPTRKDEAMKALAAALQLQPGHPGTLILLIQLSEKDSPARALLFLRQLLLQPAYADSAILRNNVGVQLVRLGKIQEARPHLLAACRQQDVAAFCNTGILFDRMGTSGRRTALNFYSYYLKRAEAAGEPAERIDLVKARTAQLSAQLK